MSDAFESARDAICERAEFLAKDAPPADLVTLADAVQKVQFGPQGQSTDYRYTQDVKQHTTTVTRYEDNGRRGAGFGSGERGR